MAYHHDKLESLQKLIKQLDNEPVEINRDTLIIAWLREFETEISDTVYEILQENKEQLTNDVRHSVEYYFENTI